MKTDQHKPIASILRPVALQDLPPPHQLNVWMAYYGYTLKDLATVTGCGYRTMVSVLNGRTSKPVLRRIQAATGIDLSA